MAREHSLSSSGHNGLLKVNALTASGVFELLFYTFCTCFHVINISFTQVNQNISVFSFGSKMLWEVGITTKLKKLNLNAENLDHFSISELTFNDISLTAFRQLTISI